MGALPVIANTYQVRFIWSRYGSNAQNVMHFQKAGSSSSALATAIIAGWGANQILSVGNSASIDTLAITPLDGSTATTEYATGSAGKWVGGSSGDVTPAASVLISLRTGSRGRSYRGRVFLPWTAKSVTAISTISPTPATAMATAWNAFNASMSGAGWSWGIASYKHSTFDSLLTLTVELELATQRRRQTRYR